jgi:quercetin dioxygenase-like cupin family protein
VTVDLVDPDEIEGDESTPGIVRKILFETETNVMVRSHIDGGTTTGWHHHGDRHAYGYFERGHAVIEYGPEGNQSRELSAPRFFHISPGVVHRELISPDEDAAVVVSFVGSGPVVVNLDRPGSE